MINQVLELTISGQESGCGEQCLVEIEFVSFIFFENRHFLMVMLDICGPTALYN